MKVRQRAYKINLDAPTVKAHARILLVMTAEIDGWTSRALRMQVVDAAPSFACA